jgi:pilus assembly protein Flp/PilA
MSPDKTGNSSQKAPYPFRGYLSKLGFRRRQVAAWARRRERLVTVQRRVPVINKAVLQLAVRFQMLRQRGADRGATAVEYGLIVALIAVAIIAGVTVLGSTIGSMFSHTASKVSSANAGAP